MLSTRTVGLTIMIAAIVVFIAGFIYTSQAEKALLVGHQITASGECVHAQGAICPFEELHALSVPKYVGGIIDAAVFAFGFWLFMQKKPEEKTVIKAKALAKGLVGEEAQVFDALVQSEGMLFQNELVETLGSSRVRITRALDKLEGKGLIERRRRGMTNAIILK